MKRITTALLIDDDPQARNILQKFLETEESVHIVASLDSTLKAFEVIIKYRPDVIFLDINMPYENGLKFAIRIKESGIETLLVFTTAFRNYALEAFTMKPFEFLLKPFGIAEISILMQKIEKHLDGKDPSLDSLLMNNNSGKLIFRTNHGYLFLLQLEIVYVHSTRNYCDLFLNSGKIEKVLSPISFISKEFIGHNFIMINRSMIVNLSYITRIDRKLKICVTSFNNKEIELPISQKSLNFFENLDTLKLG